MAEHLAKLGILPEVVGVPAFVRALQQAAQQGTDAFKVNMEDVAKHWKSSQTSMGRAFGEVAGKALQAGVDSLSLKSFQESLRKSTAELEQNMLKSQRAMAALQAGVRNEDLRKSLEGVIERAAVEKKALEERFAKERKNVERLTKIKAEQERKKKLGVLGRAEERAGRIERGVEGTGGVMRSIAQGDFGDALKSVGRGLKGGGKRLGERADVMGAGKKKAGMELMGKFMGGLGKAAGALGAIVAAGIAVYKGIVAIDAKVTELNQSLLKAGTTAADMGATVDDLKTKMRDLHDAADFSFTNTWGITGKDMGAVLTAFNQTGITVKRIRDEMGQGTTAMKAFQEATQAALVYANLLGESAPEIAEKMGTYMEGLGLTLQGVQDQFAAIYEVAKSSGFATKRFFGMVLQVTSGMSMYNVRLSETAVLLKDMMKAVGQKEGAELLQSLAGKTSKKGTQERYATMLADVGEKDTRDIVNRAAMKKARAIVTRVRDAGMTGQFDQAAKVVGVKGADFTDPKKLAVALGKATAEQRRLLIGELQGLGKPAEALAQAVSSLMDTAEAMEGTGKDKRAGILKGMGNLDLGGELALIAASTKLTGGKLLDELTGMGRVIMEQRGYSLEEQDKFAMLFRSMAGSFQVLQKEAAGITSKDQISYEMQKHQAEQYGMAVQWDEKTGKAVIKEAVLDGLGNIQWGDAAMKDLRDMLMERGAAFEALGKGEQDRQLELAKRTADATTAISHTLDQVIERLLIKIHGIAQKILGFFSEWMGEGDDKKAQKALRIAHTDLVDRKTQADLALSTTRQARKKVGGLLGSKLPPEQQAAVKEKHDALVKEEAALEQLSQRTGARISDVEDLQKGRRIKWGRKGSTTAGALLGTRAKGNPEKMVKLLTEGNVSALQTSKDQVEKTEEVIKNLKDLPKEIAQENAALEGRRQTFEALTKALGSKDIKGGAGTFKGAADLLERGVMPADVVTRAIQSTPGLLDKLSPAARSTLETAQNAPAAHDLVMQVGAGGVKFAQRVDPNDVGVFSKPGGALSQARSGGGGPTTIHNHFYNDGQGIWNSLRKYRQAMGQVT